MKKIIISLMFIFSLTNISLAQSVDWSNVQKVFGQKGIIQNDTIRINFPRSDLKVQVNGVPIKPGLALGAWVAFKPMQDHTMMMGDLVLLQNEVEPVIKRLIANNIEITGLHNHLYGESPRIMYLHYEGHGDSAKLAQGLKNALSKTKTPLSAKATPKQAPANWQTVESILGVQGKKQGSLIQFSIPRADKITENGTVIPPLMGTSQAINIQQVGDKAVTTGDFVLTANEVNPVIKALTQNGIKVTAIHNHMLNENPRVFFLHYWGYDKPDKLGKGLKTALDNINIAK